MAGPIRADAVVAERVDWLWRERIPRGMVTIVAGRPDQGKGLFSVHLGAHVSNHGGNVLHSAFEDSHGLMTKPRYESAGANLKHIHLWRFQIPAMLEELAKYVLKNDIDLIIMDPVAAHLSRGASRHSDSIRTVLNPFTEFLEATGTSCVMIEHALKRISKNAHPLSAIGGASSALPAAARMAYLLGTDPHDEDRRVLCPVKSNLREWPEAVAFQVDTNMVDIRDTKGVITPGEIPYLMFEEECEFDPMKLFTETQSDGVPGRPPNKREEACEWLTNYLAAAGKPVPSGVVQEDAKHYGITYKTLRNAATQMNVVKLPPGGGRNVTWELPDNIKKLLGMTDTLANDRDTKITDNDISQLLGDGPKRADEIDPTDE